MRILHCCLSNFYIDGYGYQENYLPLINQVDGHEVMIVASTESIKEAKLVYQQPGRYLTESGIPIQRIPYAKLLPHMLSKKVRCYPLFRQVLNSFAPDVIMFHGSTAHAILTAANYKKEHPSTKLYVDTHEAFFNSAQNFISKVFLHKMLYRKWFRKALPHIDKVLYLGAGQRKYLIDMMGTPDQKMEFFPLGGTIIDEKEKAKVKARIFEAHGINPAVHILFVHSGKLGPLKRTEELLKAFFGVQDDHFRLFIIGDYTAEAKESIENHIAKDERVVYLGWKSREALNDYLAAADMYLQPGSVSSTLQNAICAGTPVMIFPHDDYGIYVKENGSRIKDKEEMQQLFQGIGLGEVDLFSMSKAAFRYAKEFLDYRKLAARLYV